MAITYLSGQRVQGVSNASPTDGDYTYLKFTGNGTFTPTEAFTGEYLIVGGGGGGSAGGGGAGGLLANASYSYTAQEYTITVGAGGTAGTVDTSAGGDGGDSILNPADSSAITADGGGGAGGTSGAIDGRDGGSGGGGAWAGSGTSTGGSPTSGQGYAGGNGRTADPHGAAGGGGASEVGNNCPSSGDAPRADGGDGLQNDITGTDIYYAGGGGSGKHPAQAAGGAGGQGGGGSGGPDDTPTAGTDGLGGGGAGGNNLVGNTHPDYQGTVGGSGVVLIRFLSSKGYSATGTYETIDEKTTVTDVPVGSQFEETDTRKFYQRFSSTGNTYTWSDCGSDNPLTVTDGVQAVGAWIRAGTLIGKKITKLTQKMYRVGTASGNLVCHQINQSDTGTIKATSSTVAISGLTDSTSYGSATSVEFDFTTPVEIAVNDCFIVSSDGSATKMWASTGNCDSSNTNFMESDDAGSPTFTQQTGMTARGSATYTDEGWRERGTAI